MAAATYEIGAATEYRTHLEGNPAVPLWQQPWWLTATTDDRWNAVTLHTGGRVVAALPYVEVRRLGLRAWSQPPLTQSLGPWLEPRTSKYAKRLSREHEAMGALADAIPSGVFYAQNWSPSRTNWLPFYWRGFTQTTGYTYRLDLTHGEQVLWSGLTDDTRNVIRRARQRHAVTVETSHDIERFIDLNTKVFQRQQLNVPDSPELIRKIYATASERSAARLVITHESDGTPSAGALVVRDSDTSYYLMGGAHPVLRNSGSQTLAIWEAVVGEIGVTKCFDFEGSMIRPVERAFRAFGAQQCSYLRVEGSHSRTVRLLMAARALAKS